MAWVKLNVEGRRFETSLVTLRKFPLSKLSERFELESVKEHQMMKAAEGVEISTDNNVYNLDLDPSSFSVVLTWLR